MARKLNYRLAEKFGALPTLPADLVVGLAGMKDSLEREGHKIVSLAALEASAQKAILRYESHHGPL